MHKGLTVLTGFNVGELTIKLCDIKCSSVLTSDTTAKLEADVAENGGNVL